MDSLFIDGYYNKDGIYEKFNKLDELLYLLCPETGRPWTIERLESYLNYVYFRANKLRPQQNNPDENSTIVKYFIENEKYFIMDTTLLDKNYQSIYVIKSIDDIKQPYCEFGSIKKIVECLKNQYDIKEDEFNLLSRIKRVKFFNDMKDLEYLCECPEDNDIEINADHVKHILIDGSDNLPLGLLNTFLEENCFNKEKDTIKSDVENLNDSAKKNLLSIIERAKKETLNRFKSDKSLIAPIYFPKCDKGDSKYNVLSYILPLYISHGEKPDCVLLFNKDEDRKKDEDNNKEKKCVKYVAMTLLNMDEAYTDVRLLGTVDMYPWLQ